MSYKAVIISADGCKMEHIMSKVEPYLVRAWCAVPTVVSAHECSIDHVQVKTREYVHSGTETIHIYKERLPK